MPIYFPPKLWNLPAGFNYLSLWEELSGVGPVVKEEKNILNLYLSKVAQGDRSYIGKLASRLADRLLFIPVLSKSANRSTTKINVYRHRQAEREVVPVFTTEKHIKSWEVGISASLEHISVLGADLCAALGDQNWLSIDEGCSHSCTIEPELVIRIANTGNVEAVDEEPAPALIELTPQQIVASPTVAAAPPPPPEPAAAPVNPVTGSRFQDWD